MTDADLLKRVDAFARKHKKNELIEMCRNKNLSLTGSKHDLAKRIHGVIENSSMTRLSFQRPVVLIQRTREGFYVHEPTGLVFDKNSKRVTGRLESVYTEENEEDVHQRVVVPLRRQDLQLCQQYKFRAVMPVFLEESFKEGRETWYNRTDTDRNSDDEEEEEEENTGEFL